MVVVNAMAGCRVFIVSVVRHACFCQDKAIRQITCDALCMMTHSFAKKPDMLKEIASHEGFVSGVVHLVRIDLSNVHCG